MDPVTLGMAKSDAKKKYSPKRFARAVEFSPFPGSLNNTWGWNGQSYTQDGVTTTADGTQYAVWVDDGRNPIVGKRTLPGGKWQTYNLTNVPGNPFVNLTNFDNHNVYVVAVDPQGHILVAGNMHGHALRMARSTNPGDITAWTAVTSMTGLNENAMSYPCFITRHTDGALFFHYRNGASGDGNTYLNRWTGTEWVQVAQLTDGSTTTESAYETTPAFDNQGRFCYGFTWRDNTLGNTDSYNNASDLSFIRSTDATLTAWETYGGAPVNLPVQHTEDVVIVPTAPRWSGLSGQCGWAMDQRGNHYWGGHLHDGDITQVRTEQPSDVNRQLAVAWHDGNEWQTEMVTDFTGSLVDSFHRPSRPSIFCVDDRVYMLYTYAYEGRRGALICVEATPGSDHQEFPLMEWDMRDQEVTYDREALRLRNELHIIAAPTNFDANAPRPEYWDGSTYSKQLGGVLSVDLAQLDKVQDRAVALPHWKLIATSVTPTGLGSTFSGSAANLSAPLVVPQMYRDRIIGVRLSVRAKSSATGVTSTFYVWASPINAGGSYTLFSMPFTNFSSTALKVSPIVPVWGNGSRNGYDLTMWPRVTVDNSGTVTVDAMVMELFVLDGPVFPKV